LGLQQHHKEAPRIDSSEEQHNRRKELDRFLRRPAIPAGFAEQAAQPGSVNNRPVFPGTQEVGSPEVLKHALFLANVLRTG
jgi:hypothetical protein